MAIVLVIPTHHAFGSTPANSDPDGDKNNTIINLRFAGQYFDQESGLHYNHHRYYDPKGRYLSADPIGLDGGLNLFNYANASPLRFTDPSGKVFIAPAIFYGALGLATAGAAWWAASHPPVMSNGGNSDGDSPFADSTGNEKSCSPPKPPKCHFAYEKYWGGPEKSCVYKQPGSLFTIRQYAHKPCPPIDPITCWVDTRGTPEEGVKPWKYPYGDQ